MYLNNSDQHPSSYIHPQKIHKKEYTKMWAAVFCSTLVHMLIAKEDAICVLVCLLSRKKGKDKKKEEDGNEIYAFDSITRI